MVNQQLINRFYGSTVYHWSKEYDKSFCSLVTKDNFVIATAEDTQIEGINIQSEMMAIVKCNQSGRQPYRAYCSSLPDVGSLILLHSLGIRELYYYSATESFIEPANRLAKKLSFNLMHLEPEKTDTM